MRAESGMHLQQAGTQPQAGSLRRVPGSSASLRRNTPVREGTEKAQGVDRAAVWRGQGLARDEKVPTTEAQEGEHRSFADRLGAERQAAARLRRSRTEEAGTGSGPTPGSRYRLQDRSPPGAPRRALLAAKEAVFQQAGTFWGQGSERLAES